MITALAWLAAGILMSLAQMASDALSWIGGASVVVE